MAEPGDPHVHDHDDLIGFTSPSSLAAVERRAEPEPIPEPEPLPEPTPAVAQRLTAFEPIHTGRDDPGDDLFDDLDPVPVAPVRQPAPEPPTVVDALPADDQALARDSDDLGPLFGDRATPVPPRTVADEAPVPPRPTAANLDFETPPAPQARLTDPASPAPRLSPAEAALAALPAWARETVRPPKQPPAAFGRARRAEPPQGAMGLYTVYALILFAVPTFGVSALIGLFAVTGRPVPEQPLAQSHFVFQKRTLWIAAVGAALGVVLIAVNLGVFVLFAMALWVLLRGSAGLIRLAAGRAIRKPTTLLI